MTYRERLSATVDPQLLKAGRTAVREGRATSLSAWVNDALARQADHGRRAGVLLGRVRRSDVIDAALVVLAEDGDEIFTADPADLRELAQASGKTIDLIRV